MNNRALINIDMTEDFVNGRLPVGDPAIAIDNRISQLVEEFANRDELVISMIDEHQKDDPYHPETKPRPEMPLGQLFPDHNNEDGGRELYGETGKVVAKWLVSKQGNFMFYTFPKTRYNAFAGTPLDIKLRERGVKEVHLVGVCTDICVLHTAIAAYDLGYEIVVHVDGVASFDPIGHRWALGHFQNTLGAKLYKDGMWVKVNQVGSYSAIE